MRLVPEDRGEKRRGQQLVGRYGLYFVGGVGLTTNLLRHSTNRVSGRPKLCAETP